MAKTTYTLSVEARFAFDVEADSPEQALAKGRKLLRQQNPVNDDGSFSSGYYAPWVDVAQAAAEDYKTLEVVDEYEEVR